MDTHSTLTDLSDAEWQVVQPLLPPEAKPTGRPRQHPLRTMVHAMVYVLRAGCAWRLLPHEWPAWQTVYHSFRRWRLDGTWQRGHLALRQRLRIQLGRDPEPSFGSIDSQSVKTTAVGGVRGYDGAKQVVGCKRHVLVDTEGVICAPERAPREHHGPGWGQAPAHPSPFVPGWCACTICGSLPASHGRGKGKDWIEQVTGWTVQTVKAVHRSMRYWVPNDLPPEQIDWSQYLPTPGFHGIPRRWVVEGTFAWLSHGRRLSKDYERLCTTSEAWIYVAMIRLMAKRLARS